MDNQHWDNFLSYLERPQRGQFDGSNADGVPAIDLVNERSYLASIATKNDIASTEALDLLKRCRLEETENVVVLSSDSENDDETIWSSYAKCKDYKRLWEKARCLVFYRLVPKYYHCASVSKEPYFMKTAEEQIFPYNKLKNLAEDLRKFVQDYNHNEEELNFLWKNVLQWLLALNQSLYPIDAKYDENFNLILIDFMTQYVNYITNIAGNFTDEERIRENIQKIVQTLTVILSGNTFYALMVLLRIDLKLEYRVILDPIFKKYLTDPNLCHASTDLVVYLQLIFCFKRWKLITPQKTDRESINDIAVGKSLRKLNKKQQSEVTDLTTESILPKSVPRVNEKNKFFVSISDLIGFAMERKAFGTRILLVYTSLDLEDAIAKFLQMYVRYVSCNPGFGIAEATTATPRPSRDMQGQFQEAGLMNNRKKRESPLRQQQHQNQYQHQHREYVPNQQSRKAAQSEKHPKVCKRNHETHFEKNCDKNRLSYPLSYSVSNVSHSYTTNTQSDISLSSSKCTSVNKNTELTQINLSDSDEDLSEELNRSKQSHVLKKVSDFPNGELTVKNNLTLPQSEIQKNKMKKSCAQRHRREKKHIEVLGQVTEVNSYEKHFDGTIDLTSSSSSDDENSLVKYLKNSDSDTVCRQNTLPSSFEANALPLEQSLPRIAAVPPRLRPLVESVATKPTRKEKHCIPGEVSSTTSPDCGVQMNSSQSSKVTPEKETTSSSFQYNVSNLEVHSAGTLQNAREVGIVKAVQQRVSPCPPVVVSGTCKPGSLLLGIDYSDFSSDNEDLESEFGSHLRSHGSWKVVEEATSSTAEFPKNLSENIAPSAKSDRSRIKSRFNSSEKISLLKNSSINKEEFNLSHALKEAGGEKELVDKPTCSKYIENRNAISVLEQKSRTEEMSGENVVHEDVTKGAESLLSTDISLKESMCVDESIEKICDDKRTAENKCEYTRSVLKKTENNLSNEAIEVRRKQWNPGKNTFAEKECQVVRYNCEKIVVDSKLQEIGYVDTELQNDCTENEIEKSQKNSTNNIIGIKTYPKEKKCNKNLSNVTNQLGVAVNLVEIVESTKRIESSEAADIASLLKEIDENLNETPCIDDVKSKGKDDKLERDSKRDDNIEINQSAISSVDQTVPFLCAKKKMNVRDSSQQVLEERKASEKHCMIAENKLVEGSAPKFKKKVAIDTSEENENSVNNIRKYTELEIEEIKRRLELETTSALEKNHNSKNSLLVFENEIETFDQISSLKADENNTVNMSNRSEKEPAYQKDKLAKTPKDDEKVEQNENWIESKEIKDQLESLAPIENVKSTVKEKHPSEDSSLLILPQCSTDKPSVTTGNFEQDIDIAKQTTTLNDLDVERRPLHDVRKHDNNTTVEKNLKENKSFSESSNLVNNRDTNINSISSSDVVLSKEALIHSLKVKNNVHIDGTEEVLADEFLSKHSTEKCEENIVMAEIINKGDLAGDPKVIEYEQNESFVAKKHNLQLQNELEQISPEHTENKNLEFEEGTVNIDEVHSQSDENVITINTDLNSKLANEFTSFSETAASSELSANANLEKTAQKTEEKLISCDENSSTSVETAIETNCISNIPSNDRSSEDKKCIDINVSCKQLSAVTLSNTGLLVSSNDADNEKSLCASSKNISENGAELENPTQTHQDEEEILALRPNNTELENSQNRGTNDCIDSMEIVSEASSTTIMKLCESSTKERHDDIARKCEFKSLEVSSNKNTDDGTKEPCDSSCSSIENAVEASEVTTKFIEDPIKKLETLATSNSCLAASLKEKKVSILDEHEVNEFNVETQILKSCSKEKPSKLIKQNVSELSNKSEKVIEVQLSDIQSPTINKEKSSCKHDSNINRTKELEENQELIPKTLAEIKELKEVKEIQSLLTQKSEQNISIADTKETLKVAKLQDLENSLKLSQLTSTENLKPKPQADLFVTSVIKQNEDQKCQSEKIAQERKEKLQDVIKKSQDLHNADLVEKSSDATLNQYENQKELSTTVKSDEIKDDGNAEQFKQPIEESKVDNLIAMSIEDVEKRCETEIISDGSLTVRCDEEIRKEISSTLVESVQLKGEPESKNKTSIHNSKEKQEKEENLEPQKIGNQKGDANKELEKQTVQQSNINSSSSICQADEEHCEAVNSTLVIDVTSSAHANLKIHAVMPSILVENIKLKNVNKDDIKQSVPNSAKSNKGQEIEKHDKYDSSEKLSDDISAAFAEAENGNEILTSLKGNQELNVDVNKNEIGDSIQEGNLTSVESLEPVNVDVVAINSEKMSHETNLTSQSDAKILKEISETLVEKTKLKAEISKKEMEPPVKESNDNTSLTCTIKDEENEDHFQSENSNSSFKEKSIPNRDLEKLKKISTLDENQKLNLAVNKNQEETDVVLDENSKIEDRPAENNVNKHYKETLSETDEEISSTLTQSQTTSNEISSQQVILLSSQVGIPIHYDDTNKIQREETKESSKENSINIKDTKGSFESECIEIEKLLDNSPSSKNSIASNHGTPLQDEKLNPNPDYYLEVNELPKPDIDNVTISSENLALDFKMISCIEDYVEKRTPWKMRIKRRISLCSDISKEFDSERKDEEKVIVDPDIPIRADNIHKSANAASAHSIAKEADELAVNISRLNIRRNKTCSESDQSQVEINCSDLQKSLLGNLGLKPNLVTEANLKSSKSRDTPDKVEGRRRKQKVVRHVVEISSTSQPLELMPISYNFEELAAITALMNMQNKCTIKSDEEVNDLENKDGTADIDVGSTETGKHAKVCKVEVQSKDNEAFNIAVRPIKPILKTSLKNCETLNQNKIIKKVKYDEASILHLQKHNETRQCRKAYKNLKKTRSEEGALLKGGNKFTKKRLAEINARFEEETKIDIQDLRKLPSSIEAEKRIKSSAMSLRNKNKISDILEKLSISPSRKSLENAVSTVPAPKSCPASLEKNVEISKARRGRKKKIVQGSASDEVKPAICTEPNYPVRLTSRKNNKNLIQNKCSASENETLTPTLLTSIEISKLLPMKIFSGEKKTETSIVSRIGDEPILMKSIVGADGDTILPCDQNVPTSDSTILQQVKEYDLSERGNANESKSNEDQNTIVNIKVERLSKDSDIQESRKRNIKLKKAFVKIKRTIIPKHNAIITEVVSSQAILMNSMLQESQIKKEPTEEIQPKSTCHKTIDIEIKEEEDSLDSDKFSNMSNDFSFTERPVDETKAQTSRKEIVLRPCDVILTADIINAQANRLTEIAKERRKIKKISTSGNLSIRKNDISSKLGSKNDSAESGLKCTASNVDKSPIIAPVKAKRSKKQTIASKSKDIKNEQSPNAVENINNNKIGEILKHKENDSSDFPTDCVKSKNMSSIEGIKNKVTDLNKPVSKIVETLLEKETLTTRKECKKSNKIISTEDSNTILTSIEKYVPDNKLCKNKYKDDTDSHLSISNDIKDLKKNKKHKSVKTKRSASSHGIISDGDEIIISKPFKTKKIQGVCEEETLVDKDKTCNLTGDINKFESCESWDGSRKGSSDSVKIANMNENMESYIENDDSQKLIEESNKGIGNETSTNVPCTTINKTTNLDKSKQSLKGLRPISKIKSSLEEPDNMSTVESVDHKIARLNDLDDDSKDIEKDKEAKKDKIFEQTSSSSNDRSISSFSISWEKDDGTKEDRFVMETASNASKISSVISSDTVACENKDNGEKEKLGYLENGDICKAKETSMHVTNVDSTKCPERNEESCQDIQNKDTTTPTTEEKNKRNNLSIDTPCKKQKLDSDIIPNHDDILILSSKDDAFDETSRAKDLEVNLMFSVPIEEAIQKSTKAISKEIIENAESADKITECVIAELKLLSPQNTLQDQSPGDLDPDVEIARKLDQGIELVMGNKIENKVETPITSIDKRSSIDDKEQKTAALLDSAIEKVLGNSASASQSAANTEVTESKPPKTTREHLDYAIDAILGGRKKVSPEYEKTQSPTKGKLGILTAEKINSSIEKLLERDKKNDLDHKTAETLNQSIEKILGQCVVRVEQCENKSIELTTPGLLKKNSPKPEDVSTKKPINKKYFTDMKIVSANVPEALFADDDSDNSNSGENSSADNLKFFPPILSLDDLLHKKTEQILKIPCCANSDDCSCNIENSDASEEPSSVGASRQCLGTPNFAIELEVETSQKTTADEENEKEPGDQNVGENMSEITVADAVELPTNLVEVNTTNMENFELSDISTIGIPIEFTMANESFPDVMDIMLLDQVQQTIDCVISGNNYVQKWSHESYTGQINKKSSDEKSRENNVVQIPAPSAQDNICISQILESNQSVGTSPCGSTLGSIEQEMNYSTMNPLDEVEVSTTIGFDLVGNVTVEDLLAHDGDDLFAFPELDKSRSRTNSCSNDSEASSNSSSEQNENMVLTTKVIACDHSYNKEIVEKDPNKIDSKQSPSKITSPKSSQNLVTIGKAMPPVKKSPSSSFTKLKSHPTPFWVKKVDVKTSTPKRSSSSDELIEEKGLTSENTNSLATKTDLSQVQKKLFYNMPELDLEPYKAKPKTVAPKSESSINKPTLSVEKQEDDDQKIDNSPSQVNAQEELKALSKRAPIEITEVLTIPAPSPVLQETITTSIECNDENQTNTEAESDKRTSPSSSPSEKTDHITLTPMIITQPIIMIQSQTNRLQRVTSVSNQFAGSTEYNSIPSSTIVTIGSVNCTPNREPTPTMDEPNKEENSLDDSDDLFNEFIEDTRESSLNRSSTPTMDEPPEKKLCLESIPKESTSNDDVFNSLKKETNVLVVAFKEIVENKVVSEASCAELKKAEPVFVDEIIAKIHEDKKDVDCIQIENNANSKKSPAEEINKSEETHLENCMEKSSESKCPSKEDKTRNKFAESCNQSKGSRLEYRCSLIDDVVKRNTVKALEKNKVACATPNSLPEKERVNVPSPIKSKIKTIPNVTVFPKQDNIIETPACKQTTNANSTKSTSNSTAPEENTRKLSINSNGSCNKPAFTATLAAKSSSSHFKESSKTPPSQNSRMHPYHNSPNNDRVKRNRYVYQRVISSSETNNPSKCNNVTFHNQSQQQQHHHKQAVRPMAEKKSQFMSNSGFKPTPSMSSHSNAHRNSSNGNSIISTSNIKLSAADEAELRARLDAFQKTLPQTKIYREHREQQLLLKLQEEKLRLEYFEKEKRKQAQKLVTESQRVKRKSNSESYEGHYKKFAFSSGSNVSNCSSGSGSGSASSTSSSLPSHHRQVQQQQHSHKQQYHRHKYVNKFGEIEKNAAISRNSKDNGSSKTPLTITTAWEHKSASVDEIIEHLAKMKKP